MQENYNPLALNLNSNVQPGSHLLTGSEVAFQVMQFESSENTTTGFNRGGVVSSS